MGDTIKEIESVIEEITNTTDPIASVGVLVDWVAVMLNKVSASSTPSHAAVDLSGALLTHKDALATAVVANTQTPGGVTDMPPAGGDGEGFSQSAQHG